jgi:predicted nucleic acid-binding protein
MVNLLLDTTVLVHLYRQRSEVITIIQALKPRNIYISTISYAEFLGATKKRQKQYARKFLKAFKIVEFNSAINRQIQLQSFLQEIPPQQIADCFIACTAITLKMPLLTNNATHFKRYSDLELLSYTL